MIETLFAFLFLFSIIALIVGVIKPSLFNRILKREVTRKKLALIFGALSFVFFISVGITAPKTEVDQTGNEKIEVSGTEEQKMTQEDIVKSEIKPETKAESDTNQPQTTSVTAIPTTPQYTYYSVVSVVDGDTIKINIDGTTTTLRLIGIDTPETVDPRKPVQCFGKEASNKAKELLSNKKVRIEKDSTQGDLDKYGRLLVYIWRDDGLFYNDYMIRQGYAHEYTYSTPYKYQAQFKADEKYARENQLGLWSPNTCNGNTTVAATVGTTTSAQTTSTTTTQTSGKYYTSSYASSKYYYPEACSAWKSLSQSYLKVFNSLSELLSAYPTKTLSPQCQ
jgi:micrococcal nuclease